mgnify:CR=1 FL=1
MKIMLLGASGLTGQTVLPSLMAQPGVTEVIALLRHRLKDVDDVDHNRRLQQVIVDFEQLASESGHFAVDGVACCLGTTRKQAGSKAGFRRVDFDYVVQAAQLAKAAGARCFSVISAQGADPGSPIFYSRVKGEMEEALISLNFDHLAIFRPGLLIGNREESRPAEALFGRLAPVLDRALIGPLRRYQSTDAEQLGAAIAAELAQALVRGDYARVSILTNEEIQRLAKAGND